MSGRDARATIDPILPALADTVQRYRIPPHHFHELLDGTEMDQTKTRYETFDELYKYCYHVASVVGLIVLPIFGYKDERGEGTGRSLRDRVSAHEHPAGREGGRADGAHLSAA